MIYREDTVGVMNQVPRTVKILWAESRLALWGKVSYLLVFKKARLIAMGPSLPCTYC